MQGLSEAMISFLFYLFRSLKSSGTNPGRNVFFAVKGSLLKKNWYIITPSAHLSHPRVKRAFRTFHPSIHPGSVGGAGVVRGGGAGWTAHIKWLTVHQILQPNASQYAADVTSCPHERHYLAK